MRRRAILRTQGQRNLENGRSREVLRLISSRRDTPLGTISYRTLVRAMRRLCLESLRFHRGIVRMEDEMLRLRSKTEGLI